MPRTSSCYPEHRDVIIQTDQRIVFNSSHHPSDIQLEDAERITIKNKWSQTHWEFQDKEVQVSYIDKLRSSYIPCIDYQVHPDDLDNGEGDEWSGWRRKEANSINTATQVTSFHFCI